MAATLAASLRFADARWLSLAAGGLGLGLMGLLGLWICGLLLVVGVADLAVAVTHLLALILAVAGFTWFPTCEYRMWDGPWLRGGWLLRSAVGLTAFAWAGYLAIYMDWFGMGELGTDVAEWLALGLWPMMLLAFMVFATMLRTLAWALQARTLAWHFAGLHWVWSMLLMVALAQSMPWAIGLGWLQANGTIAFIAWVYPIVAWSEWVGRWIVLALVGWLMVSATLLMLRMNAAAAAAGERPTEGRANLPNDPVWPFRWTRRRTLIAMTALLLLWGMSLGHVMYVRPAWQTRLAIDAARTFVQDPSRADTEALGIGLQKGLLPESLGNAVLAKTAEAELTRTPQNSSTTILVICAYPNELSLPPVGVRGEQQPILARPRQLWGLGRMEVQPTAYRNGEWDVGGRSFRDTSRCFHYGSRNSIEPRFQMMYGFTSACRTDLTLTYMKPQRFPVSASDQTLRKLVLQ